MKRLFKPYEPELLKKVQQAETEVLLAFDELCKKEGWTYFVHYGTLLGAVRHGGSIPWDDDIDIAMPRADFEKVKEFFCLHDDGDYGYLDPFMDPHFTKYLPLYFRKGTMFAQDQLGTMPGIGIDIFPYDYISTDPKKQRWQILRANFQRRLFYLCYRDPVIPFNGILYWVVFFICKMARLGIKIIRLDPIKLYKRFEKANKANSQKYNGSIKMTTFFDVDPIASVIDSDQFETRPIGYDGHIVNGPKDTKKMLEHLYGSDYMQLPPEEKRVNHAAAYIRFAEDTAEEFK